MNCSHPRSVFLLSLLVSSLAASLRAADPAAPAPTETKTAEAAQPVISVGMKAAEIRAAIGNPARVKPVKNDEVKAEIWYYNYSKVVGARQVVTSTEEVPYYDSMSNSIQTRAESVYGLENTAVTETTELLIVDGVLVSTKRYRSKDRSFE